MALLADYFEIARWAFKLEDFDWSGDFFQPTGFPIPVKYDSEAEEAAESEAKRLWRPEFLEHNRVPSNPRVLRKRTRLKPQEPGEHDTSVDVPAIAKPEIGAGVETAAKISIVIEEFSQPAEVVSVPPRAPTIVRSRVYEIQSPSLSPRRPSIAPSPRSALGITSFEFIDQAPPPPPPDSYFDEAFLRPPSRQNPSKSPSVASYSQQLAQGMLPRRLSLRPQGLESATPRSTRSRSSSISTRLSTSSQQSRNPSTSPSRRNSNTSIQAPPSRPRYRRWSEDHISSGDSLGSSSSDSSLDGFPPPPFKQPHLPPTEKHKNTKRPSVDGAGPSQTRPTPLNGPRSPGQSGGIQPSSNPNPVSPNRPRPTGQSGSGRPRSNPSTASSLSRLDSSSSSPTASSANQNGDRSSMTNQNLRTGASNAPSFTIGTDPDAGPGKRPPDWSKLPSQTPSPGRSHGQGLTPVSPNDDDNHEEADTFRTSSPGSSLLTPVVPSSSPTPSHNPPPTPAGISPWSPGTNTHTPPASRPHRPSTWPKCPSGTFVSGSDSARPNPTPGALHVSADEATLATLSALTCPGAASSTKEPLCAITSGRPSSSAVSGSGPTSLGQPIWDVHRHPQPQPGRVENTAASSNPTDPTRDVTAPLTIAVVAPTPTLTPTPTPSSATPPPMGAACRLERGASSWPAAGGASGITIGGKNAEPRSVDVAIGPPSPLSLSQRCRIATAGQIHHVNVPPPLLKVQQKRYPNRLLSENPAHGTDTASPRAPLAQPTDQSGASRSVPGVSADPAAIGGEVRLCGKDYHTMTTSHVLAERVALAVTYDIQT